MKTLIYSILFILLPSLLVSCISALEPNNDEPVLIRVINNTGEPTCGERASLEINFLFVSIDDSFNGGFILNENPVGAMYLSVVDGQWVTVEIRRQGREELLAVSRVQIWTESRDANFEDEVRTITYCDGDEMLFDFF